MNTETAVFVSDAISLQNTVLPLSTLVQSIEAPLAKAIEWDVPYGMPVNLSHDLCRPVGWSEPRGIYIARDMSRLVGKVYRPENEADQKQISDLSQRFQLHHSAEQVEPHVPELQAKLSKYACGELKWWHREATAAVESGLAWAVYPEFFSADSEHVDKDGLVDMAFLLERTHEIHPGVFHDPIHGLLVFAHRFFRRSLSRNNSLNSYVLQSFAEAANMQGVTARLRLDPDLIGLPASARGVMELEYWHGPHYCDDIEKIPSGVAEHKSSDADRLYSGIDKTQIWWKPPEDRYDIKRTRRIRTFEIEELIEDDSPGLDDGVYGCRYAHAEYDLADRSISHFDGAIRSYQSEAYFERIGRRIDRAGKYADYTKLFRLDGALPVSKWKQVLTDWFRGNRLVPEYLGASDEDNPSAPRSLTATTERERPALAAFICIEKMQTSVPEKIEVIPDQSIIYEERKTLVAEVGPGRVARIMENWSSIEMTLLSAKDAAANLARIVLPGDPPNPADLQNVAASLSRAIIAEAAEGTLGRIALAVGWILENQSITLSIEGEAVRVGALLEAAGPIIEPNRPTSEWAEAFRDALIVQAPPLTAQVSCPLGMALKGRLALDREADVQFGVRLGEMLNEKSSNPDDGGPECPTLD